MAYNFARFWLFFPLVLSVLIACSKEEGGNVSDAGQSDAGQEKGDASITLIGREADPMILTGKNLELLAGRDPAKLVAFRYQGRWERVPVQVDERVVVDLAEVYGFSQFHTRCVAPNLTNVPCYTDGNTLTGLDTDPTIDQDDEVVCMARDAAQRPGVLDEPEGVIKGSGVEVSVSEPGDGEQNRYLYLFTNDGSLDPEAPKRYGEYSFSLNAGDYFTYYQFCGGPNPEDSWFKSKYYQRHFTDRWRNDVIKILAPGSSGVDILDAHYTSNTGLSMCTNDSTMLPYTEGAFVNIKNGPVRSIRSYIGAQSGGFTQRTHLLYERREDIIDNLRVHFITGGLMDIFDYSKEAKGMKYYDANNLKGLTIDGKADDFVPGSFSADEASRDKNWRMVTGRQGSMVMVNRADTNVANFAASHFYLDEASPNRQPCQGDGSYYGASGLKIDSDLPCTDTFCGSSSYFTNSLSIYYYGPGISVDTATEAVKNVYTPMEIKVSAWKPGNQAEDAGVDANLDKDAQAGAETDAGAGGKIDYAEKLTAVCQEVVSIDKNGDVQDDEKWISTYDRGGFLVREEWDKNGDGKPETVRSISYEGQDELVTEEIDDGADGSIDARTIKTSDCYSVPGYFGGSWTCELQKIDTDKNGDGKIDGVWSLEYEDKKAELTSGGYVGFFLGTSVKPNIVAEKWDIDGDGVVDQQWNATWTASGPSKIVWDSDGDGKPDEELSYSWDKSSSWLLGQEWDKDGDGEAEESVKYVYDNMLGELIKAERYRGKDRMAGEYFTYTNSGLLQTAEWDEDGDGTAETRISYTYEDQHQELLIDGGTPYTYSTTTEEWFAGEGGPPSQIIIRTYNYHADTLVDEKAAWYLDAGGAGFCIKHWGEESTPEIPLECDADGDQKIDWRIKLTHSGNCPSGWSPISRLDTWLARIEYPGPRESSIAPYSPEEKAYTSIFAPRFERVRVIGTCQPYDFCYSCVW